MYSLTVPALTSLSVTSMSSFDQCSRSTTTRVASRRSAVATRATSRRALAAGTYRVWVDGYSTSSGPYSIIVSKIAAGESCESPLALSGALVCSDGYACGAMGARTCHLSLCNNGIDDDADGDED